MMVVKVIKVIGFSFDDNDPMSLALQEYDKIKAN